MGLIGQAVDLSGAVTPDVSRDKMVIGFIIMSLLYWILSVGIWGVFVLASSGELDSIEIKLLKTPSPLLPTKEALIKL